MIKNKENYNESNQKLYLKYGFLIGRKKSYVKILNKIQKSNFLIVIFTT